MSGTIAVLWAIGAVVWWARLRRSDLPTHDWLSLGMLWPLTVVAVGVVDLWRRGKAEPSPREEPGR